VDLRFYEPKAFRTQHKSNRQASNAEDLIDPVVWPDMGDPDFGVTASDAMRVHYRTSLKLYNDLLSAGVCREQARGVLPQNLYTEYYGTVNLSNLLKFVDLRTHEGAQWEIQKVAEACLDIATDLFPETVGAYRRIRNDH
jgi:thymidylate synthase (FAD)